jgi:regulator of PEP synthase PpsR (kinase-PPPase family)
MRSFHLHLISDSTGETVSTVARAAISQFDAVEPVEHSWALVRTHQQVEKVLESVRRHPGVVLYTLVEPKLRTSLESGCHDLGIPCVNVLEGPMDVLSRTLNIEVGQSPGRQHALDADYYRRIEAMQFVLSHDDGQMLHDLNRADIILVGVSRTSKTPTCIYLANRGVKAANVPFVGLEGFPEKAIADAGPLVVGLTTSPDRLVQIRRNRLMTMREERVTDYVDPDVVKNEVAEARRLFGRRGWHVIDVSRRSIEETSAAILELYRDARDED